MAMNNRLLRPRASGFTPTSIANLSNWWDAADSSTVTLNGTTVSSWRNKGTGPTLAQGTASAQPTYSIASVNGKNSLTFDGGDVMTASGTYSNANATLFVVVRQNAQVDFAGVVSFHGATGNDNNELNTFLLDFSSTSNLLAWNRNAILNYAGSGLLPLSVVTGILAQSGDSLVLRTGGVVRASSTSVVSGTSTGILVGGRFQNGAVSAAFRAQMTLCEIIHYSSTLSSSQVSAVERYLGAKWGVAVA